ncbi:MAG: OmpA family protein [Myxococcota bacterium]
MRIALVALLIISAGCRKKVAPEEPVAVTPVTTTVAEPVASTEEEAVATIAANFKRVHFEMDATSLTGESEAALSSNSAILQKFGKIRVEVQGHADERGTTDYNLALGERRANAIRDRLQRMGVDAGRVTVVSYGEERPLASGGGEVVWSQNRRAEFRVLRGVPDVKIEGSVD